MHFKRLFLSLSLLASFVLPVAYAHAFSIEEIQVSGTERDFVVGPGKVELELKPGESKVVEMRISNRLGETKDFGVQVEDFSGSNSLSQPVALLGNERGPYSLKDYLKPERSQFTLKQGERGVLRIVVSVPADAEPGGRYGSVLVNTTTKPSETSTSGGAAIVARVGTLFFITVPGDVKKEGKLSGFNVQNNAQFLTSGPINFDILFDNTGSIYLNPYGELSVKNVFGQEVGSTSIDPWFAMPGATRLREVAWQREFLLGRYVATVSINRGYDNQVDTASTVFWVIPWKLLLVAFGVLALVSMLALWIFSKFEFRRKQ